MAYITPFRDGYLVQTPYDASWNVLFKAQVDSKQRRPLFEHGRFAGWMVTAGVGHQVLTMINKFFFVTERLPPAPQPPYATIPRSFQLDYIGRAKYSTVWHAAVSNGHVDGSWSVVFPEAVVQRFFQVPIEGDRPTMARSAYATLGVAQTASPDAIKKAHRKMVRLWHPDVNKEPDATAQFEAIDAAYKQLSDPMGRRRYDVGLAMLERSTEKIEALADRYGYRAPMRCGFIQALGTERVLGFLVETILRWEDVKNQRGEIMVTYWSQGADKYTTEWVRL